MVSYWIVTSETRYSNKLPSKIPSWVVKWLIYQCIPKIICPLYKLPSIPILFQYWIVYLRCFPIIIHVGISPFFPVILRTWIYESCYYSLFLEIFRFDSSMWAAQKYWTVPCERSARTDFSTGQKFDQYRENVAKESAMFTYNHSGPPKYSQRLLFWGWLWSCTSWDVLKETHNRNFRTAGIIRDKQAWIKQSTA